MFGKFKKNKSSVTPNVQAAKEETVKQPPKDYDRLLQIILAGLKDERGVHVETALATLGALAGFSAQLAARKALIDSGKIPEEKVFLKVGTKDGRKFYFGDVLNDPLFRAEEGHVSLFSMTAGMAHSIGATQFPDLKKIIERTASTCGSESFAMLSVADSHQPKFAVQHLLRDAWPVTQQWLLLNDGQQPLKWPFLIAAVTQTLIRQAKGAIDPNLITQIVMESAIPMSKVDPDEIIGKRDPQNVSINMEATDAGKLLASNEFQEALKRTQNGTAS